MLRSKPRRFVITPMILKDANIFMVELDRGSSAGVLLCIPPGRVGAVLSVQPVTCIA